MAEIFFLLRMMTGHTLVESLRARRSRFPAGIAQRNLGDSCGCAMGARFLAVALVFASAWYAWHWHSSVLSVWAILLRALLWSSLAAVAGKIVGILVFRARRRKPST
jgi:hypothetical protein